MFLFGGIARAQTPPFEWTYGANGDEYGNDVVHITRCMGGGFLVVGSTESSGSVDSTSATAGDSGIYIIRVNENGNPVWR